MFKGSSPRVDRTSSPSDCTTSKLLHPQPSSCHFKHTLASLSAPPFIYLSLSIFLGSVGIMSSRSFAVFLDNPQPEILKPKASHNVADSPLSPSTPNVNINYSNALTTGTEKENLHPVTGERPGLTNASTGKKRKPSVSILATKVHNPPTNKKQKESSKSLKPEAKKRKSSSSTSSSTTTKSKSSSSDKESKRAGSTLGSAKKPSTSSRSSKSSSRKVSPMPKLEEEGDVLGRERERIRQSEIDSRCYELTVSPLADVTRAYDTSSSMEYLPSGKLVLSRSVKVISILCQLHDVCLSVHYRKNPQNPSFVIAILTPYLHLHPCPHYLDHT